MKKNHEKVIQLIHQAIKATGYDNSLSDTRKLLATALETVGKVGAKRTKQEEWRKFYEKQAKEKAEIWWEMVKKNAASQLDQDAGESV